MLMKKSSKKSEHLTAAQARVIAIPNNNSFMEDGLQSIYKAIRKAAEQGNFEVLWRHSSFSDDMKAIIKRRLEDDGYYITDANYFVWRISWKELW